MTAGRFSGSAFFWRRSPGVFSDRHCITGLSIMTTIFTCMKTQRFRWPYSGRALWRCSLMSVPISYHPLTMISSLLNYQLHGLQAGGYHLVNVLLHTLSVILVVSDFSADDRLHLAQRVCGGGVCHSSVARGSVAWVAERKDVLSGFFFMLTLWALRDMQKNGRESRVEPSKAQANPATPLNPRRSTMSDAFIFLRWA